ncbi:MAG: alpha-glucan family phosphorylase [Betaproteobacteria bacterium]|nr:alpha-glucan family phosphorylase [Betaproteobacteria bacterium]
MPKGTSYPLQVNPNIPPRLSRLAELADNLWYSWDRATRSLFARLHPSLWESVGHSPKALLRRVDEKHLVRAASDPAFLALYNRVLSAYDSYHSEPAHAGARDSLAVDDLIVYFCAEFGFHESLPIYSGGLGILAGDYCKAASDLRLPFVGVGLLYRQGYFHQTIDREGNQHATDVDSDFDTLPVMPVAGAGGAELHVAVEIRGRRVEAKVWRVRTGHVQLYLLDTDVPQNSEHDRAIAHRLYGGDRNTRIEQEIVLGVGGVRALAALNITPTVWHINEGHAAFLLLERIRGAMRENLDFQTALEAVAVNTVFTTHTAVPAGHDQFAESMIAEYFDRWCRELGVPVAELCALGRYAGSGDFNMTALAVRGSRHQNGVSRIHGQVSSEILTEFWPQIDTEDNPVDYVVNGVHVPSFLSPEWVDVFERFLGFDWSSRTDDPECWRRLERVPDQMFWSMHQFLKSQMLHLVRYRVRAQHARNQGSEAHLDRLLRFADPADPNVLTIGFARRFATYKRAMLLFDDLEWLREILADAQRPVLFLFAGKAHPADQPGQDLIRRLAQVSRSSEFEGKVLLIEGYDLRLARRLVSGVDVWLNNPIYPLEASGTSGMKAGMNGVLNLSVLDGWWGEGYTGDNGWAIKPASQFIDQHVRNGEEARTLYEILQDQVIPSYYNRGAMGFSPQWIRMAKRSIATILPRFNATRMVTEYLHKFYVPAAHKRGSYLDHAFAGARQIAAWKSRVRAAWPGVSIRRLGSPGERIRFGESLLIEVGARLNGLEAADLAVELVLERAEGESGRAARLHRRFLAGAAQADGEQLYFLELAPELCGLLDYRIRAYPTHALLTHPFEPGLMVWA